MSTYRNEKGEFNFVVWHKIIYDIEIENEDKQNRKCSKKIAKHLTRKAIKEAIQLVILTGDHSKMPDDMSNSDISNESEEIKKNRWSYCFPCFFRKKYNIA
jgi:predicted metal-dependent HD superfamily phosphohydrolase